MPQVLGALSILALPAIVLIRTGVLKSRGVTTLARAWHEADTSWVSWIGVALCALALLLIVLSLFWFGRSFRVGIDAEYPGQLVTSGIFGISRNPMYVAFALLLLGELLIQPSPLLSAYLLAGLWLFHRQVLREEAYLSEYYGEASRRYCERVRRYF